MKNFLRKWCRLKTVLSKEEMEDIIAKNNNAILLDVRSPQEYKEEHLDGAINIPAYELYYKAQRIIPDKETIIIAYCTLGLRSKKAIKILKKIGYKNLYSLEYGIG